MMPRVALALPLLFAGLAPAAEHPPAVIDNEHLFGKEAIDRVAQVVADLREVNQIDLCIETMKEAPGLPTETQRKMKDRKLHQALRYAAQDRAEQLGVHGLYVMITTNPKHVTVVGWPADWERHEAGSLYKREQLRKALAKMVLARNPDETLIQAVEQYRARVRAPARPSPLQTLPAVAVAGGLLGAWLLLRLLRARSLDRRPIYQPAMLGSIFGVPAGFWINDRLFQAERPPAVVEVPQPPTEATVVANPDAERVTTAPGGDQP
jgi:hypothetical protein